jgi:hypothetical protein
LTPRANLVEKLGEVYWANLKVKALSDDIRNKHPGLTAAYHASTGFRNLLPSAG